MALFAAAFVTACGDSTRPTNTTDPTTETAPFGGYVAAELRDIAAVDGDNVLWIPSGDSLVRVLLPTSSGSSLSWWGGAGVFLHLRGDTGTRAIVDLYAPTGQRAGSIRLDSLATPRASQSLLAFSVGGIAGTRSGSRLIWSGTYYDIAGLGPSSTVVGRMPYPAAAPSPLFSPMGSHTCPVSDGTADGMLLFGTDTATGSPSGVPTMREFDARTGAIGRRVVLPSDVYDCPLVATGADAIYLLLGGIVMRVSRATFTIEWQLPSYYSGVFALSPDESLLAVGRVADAAQGLGVVRLFDRAGVKVREFTFGVISPPATAELLVTLVPSLQWSADGRSVLVSIFGALLRNPRQNAVLRRFDAVTGAVLATQLPASRFAPPRLIPMR